MREPYKIYKDGRGKWRWKIVAANGRILAASSQGFYGERDAKRNLIRVKKALQEIKVKT